MVRAPELIEMMQAVRAFLCAHAPLPESAFQLAWFHSVCFMLPEVPW